MNNFLLLLYPRLQSFKHRARSSITKEAIKPAILSFIGIIFWSGIFFIFYRVLAYFQGIEILGDFLAAKLLSMVFLVFFSILIFSNIITSLSTYFLSDDLQLIFSFPVSLGEIFLTKMVETTFNSSWMVLLFGLPIFLAYGIIYHAPLIFYGLCFVVFIPFLIIASCIGVFISMILVNFFPARRTRDILFLLSILFIVFLYLLFRFLKPETLVNPENFANLIDYFTALKTFSSPLLPSFWATEALFPFLHSNQEKDIGFYILMLWSTGLSLLVIGNWLASRIYFNGWSKSQESRKLRLSRSSFFNHTIDIITRPFSPSTRVIIEKELKTFFRDTTQWSQLLLLLSLVIVYIYNFKVLPLEKSPIPSFYLQNLFSFLNLGLAGFVLSAIAVRFVFPAVSVEGQAFWLIKTSPLSLKRFLWSKFWMSLIPLLILAQILTVVTNYLLKVTDFMMGLSMVTIFFMTFSITSLGIGMGAIYPRFKHGNTAEISSGFGGLMYMIYAIGLIALTIVLEARPVYILFMHQFRKLSIPMWFYLEITVAIFLILLINFAAIIFPIRYGLKHLDSMENIE
ncbi:MAG: hypothetical protein DRG25_01790 [Deltaproteobacteria bacterium]|nr:MAG: hypothetical protein DRG25_01790 [Deltaproteobacteria bacterium]